MSGAKHTPGELHFAGQGILTNAYGDEIDLGSLFDEPDARRLVACWNACRGLSTEALEAGVVAELINAELSQGPTKIAATLAKLEKTK